MESITALLLESFILAALWRIVAASTRYARAASVASSIARPSRIASINGTTKYVSRLREIEQLRLSRLGASHKIFENNRHILSIADDSKRAIAIGTAGHREANRRSTELERAQSESVTRIHILIRSRTSDVAGCAVFG